MGAPEYNRRRVGAYLGLGAGFAGSTLLFAVFGMFLDRKLGTSPAFTLMGTFVGAAGGFYSLYRRAKELQEEEEEGGGPPPDKGREEDDGNTEPLE
jgi:F0F1-type ATP synthase assembly protein I